jgi:hypothetical protein
MRRVYRSVDYAYGEDQSVMMIWESPSILERALRWLGLSRETWEVRIVKSVRLIEDERN